MLPPKGSIRGTDPSRNEKGRTANPCHLATTIQFSKSHWTISVHPTSRTVYLSFVLLSSIVTVRQVAKRTSHYHRLRVRPLVPRRAAPTQGSSTLSIKKGRASEGARPFGLLLGMPPLQNSERSRLWVYGKTDSCIRTAGMVVHDHWHPLANSPPESAQRNRF